jgi:hypothetical protein
LVADFTSISFKPPTDCYTIVTRAHYLNKYDYVCDESLLNLWVNTSQGMFWWDAGFPAVVFPEYLMM